jgi:hypothetical protein
MQLKKLTPLFVVDDIDALLPTWTALGYELAVRVPDAGPLGFAILKGAPGELMFQTKASLKEDLPMVHARKPTALLYADVDSLTDTKKALRGAEVLIAQRKTFYGATEAWLALEGGVVLGLAEHGD